MASKFLCQPRMAFVGLGANLGDARGSLASALIEMAQLPGCCLVGVSSLYRSAPIDSSGPDYFNAVAQLETMLPPLVLLRKLQGVELRHGRERPYLNAPRTLDLDLLSYGNITQLDHELTLPHPRAHLRAFVLQPWAELAPDLVLPGLGSIRMLAGAVADQAIEVMASPNTWFGNKTDKI